MEYASLDHFFMILGIKQRMRISQLLAKGEPRTVSKIVDALKAEQSSMPHALR